MSGHRVVITGMGVISGLGKSVPEFWQQMVRGKSAIGPLSSANMSTVRFKNGCEVKDYRPAAYFEKKELDLLDRFAQFSLIPALEAVRDAGMEWTDASRRRTCVITGTSIGGQDSQEDAFVSLYKENRDRVPLYTIPRIMPSAGASHISMQFGITGPAYTISAACASSNHAIGQAYLTLRSGMADRAITGGSEIPLSFAFLKAWEAIRVVAPDVCRPFSKGRQGLSLGEGGAMLVLETLESAQKRGARIHAEIVGFGMSSDASHITKPNGLGAEAAMRMAIDDARINPEEIGYINAHGTGTVVNDAMEIAAVKAVFNGHAKELSISSTKSLHGHALGGTSALEAVATTLALKHQILPPTVNYLEPDPECDLDVVPNEAREATVEYALSNSFAFGGLNAVLAFKRWKE